ncbi:protein-L-isoaspartate(D-aspartate) O-methyltransferase [Oceanospirillum linum]|uniref:Protein-L-isoaspartate O-methyltransferase n=1 Tax=Oceanospirillum linum TaxID=966 RepID=A0A1T1HFK1_OCELI|nr:protein-L-isoaspartate(D-aspartate) O-methyltransferase [Oceanospirillum linum]OOV88623.1 protein-L-isoaspartate O-methyltransferase [Oceanospirillum linum]SEG05115.1 protein-L-isoaspartate(D-aspartate) O-methyltransferase [Oleiphilus messinensis]SMP20868.1 protein-L-isoaspartate(D-aspartate) O-methyltransferase [Oceanospirillum linum]
MADYRVAEGHTGGSWNLQGIGMTSQRTRNRMVNRLREQGIKHEELLALMSRMPRHIFLDEALSHRAYEDISLPIGHQQTLSRPWVVARMTELLLEMPERPRKVLEIGTGSGYQSAILASLFERVVSLERIGSFQAKAQKCFQALGLDNLELHHADGHDGWEAQAPYDAILVTAAPDVIPPRLLEQLSDTGVMVLPVGSGEEQSLTRVTLNASGHTSDVLAAVHFVPLQQGLV